MKRIFNFLIMGVILLIGASSFGSTLSKTLAEAGHTVTVVTPQKEAINLAMGNLAETFNIFSERMYKAFDDFNFEYRAMPEYNYFENDKVVTFHKPLTINRIIKERELLQKSNTYNYNMRQVYNRASA